MSKKLGENYRASSAVSNEKKLQRSGRAVVGPSRPFGCSEVSFAGDGHWLFVPVRPLIFGVGRWSLTGSPIFVVTKTGQTPMARPHEQQRFECSLKSYGFYGEDCELFFSMTRRPLPPIYRQGSGVHGRDCMLTQSGEHATRPLID